MSDLTRGYTINLTFAFDRVRHHANRPVKFRPPYTSLLHIKTWGLQGYMFTLIFFFLSLKLDCANSLEHTCTHNLCFEQDITILRLCNIYMHHDFVMTTHHVNTPVSFVPPYTTLLQCKTRVYMGIPYFLCFCSNSCFCSTTYKVLVRTASNVYLQPMF